VRPLFSFDNLQFRYEPFPMGVASPFLEEALYKELVARFPSVDLFEEIPGAAPPSDLQGRRVDVRLRIDIASTPS
jgi:hypothetical protein